MAFGIYIHWPFCKSKCPYCDFNSHVAESIDHQRWLKAYLTELDYWANQTSDRTVSSIFLGGGTPSLMKPETVQGIIDFIQSKWRMTNACEITLEANPTSIEADKFQGFRAAGINRVSIGVQSLNAADLKFLGREHNPEQARAAIELAAKTFDRFSFDLIYARPNQTVESWKNELQDALKMAGNHLSLYQLTIEQGTPFFTRHARGEFQVPEQDHAADLYDVTQEIMEQAGLPAYEVSNHARPGEESRHNLTYWHYDDYIGVGPGAHGRVTLDGQKFATRTHRAPELWMERVERDRHGHYPHNPVSATAELQERIMMGLRLKEGIPAVQVPSEIFQGERFKKLVSEGFMADRRDVLVTTPQGFKCLNAVLGYLLTA